MPKHTKLRINSTLMSVVIRPLPRRYARALCAAKHRPDGRLMLEKPRRPLNDDYKCDVYTGSVTLYKIVYINAFKTITQMYYLIKLYP